MPPPVPSIAGRIPGLLPLLAAATAVLLVLAASGSPASAAPSRPNVLFIAVDDLRPELACYGVEGMHTPNIDRLAARGIRFERAYCQVAVCGASRGSLLSGCRPETTGCWDHDTLLRSRMPDVLTLPQHFRDNGYRTAFFGKVYHNPKDDAASWNVDVDAIAPPIPGNGKAYATTPRSAFIDHPSKANRRMGPATENGGDVPDEAYSDGENARRAVRLIEHFAEHPDAPFFLAVGFKKPHLPFSAPARYWDLYDRSTLRIPAREDVVDGIPWAGSNWGELKAYADIPSTADVLDDATSLRLIHGYRACVSFTDAQVGRLLDALEGHGLADDTIVVLWGDHGWYVGDFGDWCKHSNYEVATHVPLLVAAPGRDGGRASRALVEFVDIYPTLCELAGLPIPPHCQGHSFEPLLADPDRRWKKAAFSQYIKPKPGAGPMVGTSVRTDRFRYTEWRSHASGDLDAIELIDFDSDPGARINVAGAPASAEFLPGLAALAARSATGTPPAPADP